jgi:hypothetical protein
LIAAVSVTTVAGIDATIGRNWDLVVVIGLVLVLQVGALAKVSRGRPAVSLRGDLARWLEDRAAATGEPAEQIADRAVAAYRAGLHTELISAYSTREDGDS